MHWPNGFKARGEVRTQFGHVTDLLPTALELAGAKAPVELHGIKQTPIWGKSLVYSFADAKAPTRHTQQYFFLFGEGAMVRDGWKAEFSYRPDFVDIYGTWPPPNPVPNNAGKEVWELYDLNTDFNERHDLAAKSPQKLKELQNLFDSEARANNVYPLINWSDMDTKFKAFMRARDPSKGLNDETDANCLRETRALGVAKLRQTNGIQS
ncbi:MAG: hypothetical protein WDM89_21985 [Rhizomicrobium sp.]